MKLEDLDLRKVGDTIQLAGALFSNGEGGYLLLPLPEVNNLPDGVYDGLAGNLDVLDMSVEEWNTFLRQTDLVEVEALVKGEDGAIGKALLRKSTRQISQNVSWSVYRRDHYRCRYCGTNDVPLTVDHLVLWEEGGPSIEANLVTSCKECNNRRGNTDYAAWMRHPYYKRVSAGLPAMIQEQNERLVPTLAAIPRSPMKGKRKR